MTIDLKDYWDNKFIKKGMLWGTEASPVTAAAVETFKKYGCRVVCDIGCGYGRDTIWLARAGLEVIGLDISPKAIEMARDYALKENLSIDYQLMEDLPDLPAPIGGIFSTNLLQLLDENERSELISWIDRILEPAGLFCAMFLSCHDKQEYGKGTEIAPHTFASNKDGKMMYFYPREAVIHDFRDYKIIGLEEVPYIEKFADGSRHHHTMWSLTCQKL